MSPRRRNLLGHLDNAALRRQAQIDRRLTNVERAPVRSEQIFVTPEEARRRRKRLYQNYYAGPAPVNDVSPTLEGIPTVFIFPPPGYPVSEPTPPGQLYELVDGEWQALGSPVSVPRLTRSVTRLGDKIIISLRNGVALLSTDAGESFEEMLPQQGFENQRWFAFDATGRLWRVDDWVNAGFQGIRVYLSTEGDGSDWVLKHEQAGDYISDSTWWGVNHAIACHPTDPDIVAVVHNDNATDRRMVTSTINGGDSWSRVLLDNPGSGIDLFVFSTGGIAFTSSGRCIALNDFYLDDFDRRSYAHWADSPFDSFTPVAVDPWHIDDFGFMQNLTTYEEEVYVWTFHDWYSGPDSFAKSSIMRSLNNGETYEEFALWSGWPGLDGTPADGGPPGYSSGMTYDPVTELLWVFFNDWGSGSNDGPPAKQWTVSRSGVMTPASSPFGGDGATTMYGGPSAR